MVYKVNQKSHHRSDNAFNFKSGYSEAHIAACKLQQCFQDIVRKHGKATGASYNFYIDRIDNPKVYKWLDAQESTKETRGDGKLSAKVWNGLMDSLGIEGHRIKDSISFEEINAFLYRNK